MVSWFFCAFVKRILRSSSVASDLIVRCVEIETVSWHPSKTINHENVCIFQSSCRTTSKITDGVARWLIVKRLILEFSARRWDTYVQNVGVRSPGGTICNIIWSTLVDNCPDSIVLIALTGLNTRRTLGRRKHPDREVYVVDLMSVQHWAKHTIKVLYVDEKLRDKLRFDHRILIKIILTRRTLTRSLKNPCVHVVSFVRISYVFSLYRDIIVYLYIVYFIYCKIYWTSIWDYSNIFMLLGI